MQRPRIEFGTIQTFTGQPDCTVAIELPFINIALPDWLKPEQDRDESYVSSPWRMVCITKMDELEAYLNKQSLLVDLCRVSTLNGMTTVLKDASYPPIFARWVPGILAD